MDKICVIGLWHQGVVGAACLAELGHDVIAADPDEATILKLKSGKAPLHEPGLDDLLKKATDSGKLRFASSLQDAVRGRSAVLLMFDTPVDENDQSDLSGIFSAARTIAPALENDAVILVTAQVPVGTCHAIEREIKSANPSLRFAIAYSPENLRLGQAIERFRNPPMRVIGSDSDVALDRVGKLLAPFGGKWERVSLRTAEMVKHALNSYLAVSLTFANELGNLCDQAGADGGRIAEILRTEPRVGPKAMLFPGLGFSGGTLARDMQTLRNCGLAAGVPTPLLDGAWRSNEIQNRLVVNKLHSIFKSLSGRTIAVLGLAYKPETSAIRRSIAISIIRELLDEKALVRAHDPCADHAEVCRALGAGCRDGLRLEKEAGPAAEGAEVLVLITGWKEYKSLDYATIKARMTGDILIDANNLLDADEMERLGFQYIGTGRGRAKRKEG